MMIIDGYTIDAEVSASPSYENELTTYPVEAGFIGSDHAISKQTSLPVEGIVSDTPLGDVKATREFEATTGITGSGPYADSAFARLVKIHKDKLPVNVKCSLGSFDNMMMISFAPKREGGSIRFTATFQELTVITNERTVVKVATPRSRGGVHLQNAAGFLVNRSIIWRKGAPPGGTFTGNSEVIFWKADAKGNRGRLYHADQKTLLTPAEEDAVIKDMKRDERDAVFGPGGIAETSDKIDDRVDRALKMSDDSIARHGPADPKLFGFKRTGN